MHEEIARRYIGRADGITLSGAVMTTRRSETAREWVDALEHMGRKVVAAYRLLDGPMPGHDDGNPSMRVKEDG